MSKEVLHGLIADVDRLLAAGGTLAPSDEGLHKREKAVRELGQKVPALAQLADKIKRVLDAKPAEASRKLLDLLLVTRQLQVSLAKVGTDGAMEAVPKSGPWKTKMPRNDLYDLIEVLQATGTRRLEMLKEAAKRGIVADLRLMHPLLEALTDGFTELADFVAEDVLPTFGPGVVPDLHSKLDLKGNRGDARRLIAICKADPKEHAELCRTALGEGSVPVRAAAVRSLPFVVSAADAEEVALEILDGKFPIELKEGAMVSLEKLDKRSKKAIEALIHALTKL